MFGSGSSSELKAKKKHEILALYVIRKTIGLKSFFFLPFILYSYTDTHTTELNHIPPPPPIETMMDCKLLLAGFRGDTSALNGYSPRRGVLRHTTMAICQQLLKHTLMGSKHAPSTLAFQIPMASAPRHTDGGT